VAAINGVEERTIFYESKDEVMEQHCESGYSESLGFVYQNTPRHVVLPSLYSDALTLHDSAAWIPYDLEKGITP